MKLHNCTLQKPALFSVCAVRAGRAADTPYSLLCFPVKCNPIRAIRRFFMQKSRPHRANGLQMRTVDQAGRTAGALPAPALTRSRRSSVEQEGRLSWKMSVVPSGRSTEMVVRTGALSGCAGS